MTEHEKIRKARVELRRIERSIRAIQIFLSSLSASAPTRRGRVGSKPLLGGATPPDEGAGLRGKPAVGRRKESEDCPRCHGERLEWRKFPRTVRKCRRCNGTGKRIAPPNIQVYRDAIAALGGIDALKRVCPQLAERLKSQNPSFQGGGTL